MKKERLAGIEKEIIRVVSNVLLLEVKNPKIKGVVSVTKAHVTEDLKFADLYFSLYENMPGEKKYNKDIIIDGLNEIKGFLRKKIADELKLRYTPEIRIKIDDTMEHAAKIDKILNDIKNK